MLREERLPFIEGDLVHLVKQVAVTRIGHDNLEGRALGCRRCQDEASCFFAVVGMSGGEFAAAFAAGVLSLAETMDVVCSLSLLMRRRLGRGRMLCINLGPEDSAELCLHVSTSIYVAVEYSPTITIEANLHFFGRVVRKLLDEGYDAFVEIGPHPTLSGSIKATASALGKEVTVALSMHRDCDAHVLLDETRGLLRTLGHA